MADRFLEKEITASEIRETDFILSNAEGTALATPMDIVDAGGLNLRYIVFFVWSSMPDEKEFRELGRKLNLDPNIAVASFGKSVHAARVSLGQPDFTILRDVASADFNPVLPSSN